MKLKIKKLGSINRQIAGTIVVLVAGTIALCWLLNTCLLERFYLSNKEDTMLDAFQTIDKEAVDGTLYEDSFQLAFEKMCSNGNLSIIVISSDGTVELSSSGENDAMLSQLLYTIFDQDNDNAVTISSKDNYVLELQTDRRLNEEYLVMWGTLKDGNMIMMRSAVESIRESVLLSNRFLLYVGLFSVVISIIITEVLTRRITKPLLALTDISKRMSEFDFDAKYVPQKRQNEVDVLGEHMNDLSRTLEKSIRELKQANNELKQDIEQRDKNEEMRKEFLSNVSHELKTPIALIQGYAEGLQEGVSDDEESRQFYCEVIADEANKMNRMVKELLALNQIEFGKDNVTMERFDLTELVQGVISASSILMEQQGISVTFPYDEPMYVWADEFFTEQVFSNYLSNAIHYAAGEKKIDVKYQKLEDGVRVSVFNTGQQIGEEDIEHVWEKFYKADKARTREYGGSGIGLSVVKAVMDSFHRECGVINHENGVEFWFELDTKNA